MRHTNGSQTLRHCYQTTSARSQQTLHIDTLVLIYWWHCLNALPSGALLKCRNKYHCGPTLPERMFVRNCAHEQKQVRINAACGQNTQHSCIRFGLLKSSRICLCAKVNFVRTCTNGRTDDGGRTTKVRPKKLSGDEAQQKKLNGALAISACGPLHPCSLYWIRFPRFGQSLNLYFFWFMHMTPTWNA